MNQQYWYLICAEENDKIHQAKCGFINKPITDLKNEMINYLFFVKKTNIDR